MITKHKFCLILIGLLSVALIGSSKLQAKDDNQIEVPRTLGTVMQRYCSASDKHIVHIRDVHCNYYVQQTIAAIVKMLVEDYGYTLITTEGAAGTVDTSLFEVMPDKDAKEAVCKDYLKSGYLSGVEYLSITNPDLPLTDYRGVEDAPLYIQNLSEFKQVVAGQPLAKDYLEQLLDGSIQIAAKVLPGDLFDLETKYQNYRRGIEGIDQYINYIDTASGNLAISTQDYINLQRYLSIVHVKIDADQLSSELYTAIKELGTSTDKPRIETLRKAYIDYTLHQITDEDLANRVRPYFSNSEAKYPSLTTFIDIMTTKQQLDYDALMNELDSLTSKCRTTIIENHDPTATQKQNWVVLVDIMKDLLLYEKLVSLDLSHNEYQAMLNDMPLLDEIVKELSSINEEHNAADASLFSTKDEGILKNNLQVAFDFYSTADKRSCAMLEKLLAIMQTSKTNKAILLTGGFHSQAMENQLRNIDIAHTVIKPNIQEVDAHIYTSRMMQCSISPLLDVHKTSSSAMYLSLPLLFDTILTKTTFFDQVRSSFARRLLTYKGQSLLSYYNALSTQKERALFDDLLELSNLRLELTVSLGELLHTLDTKTVSDYIMQYTDAVLLKEAKSIELEDTGSEQLVKNQIFIAEYILSYFDHLIIENEIYPEVVSIQALSDLYIKTDMPEMHIINSLIGKRLEELLMDAISHFLLFSNFAKLPSGEALKLNVYSQMTAWSAVAETLDFNNPRLTELINKAISKVNTQLNFDYDLEWLIQKTHTKKSIEFPTSSTVTVESVTEWAYEQADIITNTFISPVRLPFQPNQIQDIKKEAIQAYERLRRTLYEVSHQHNLDVTNLQQEVSAMIWLFYTFDDYETIDHRQILRTLHALDMRFLKDKGYLFYVQKSMHMKGNPAILINRDTLEVSKDLIEIILHEMDIIPDEIIDRFPNDENAIMFQNMSSIGTANERNVTFNLRPAPKYKSHRNIVHEFIGHKLIFTLIADAVNKNDFTQLESILSGQDLINISLAVLHPMHKTEKIRFVAYTYKERILSALNSNPKNLEGLIEQLPKVFAEYNTQAPKPYVIRWDETKIVNISYDFLDWLQKNHTELVWILFLGGIHCESEYSSFTHSSRIGRKIYEFMFANPEEVNKLSVFELIAYAMAYDTNPREASGIVVRFNDPEIRKIRHILSSKLLCGWLWYDERGWFYNANPEDIVKSLINLEGPDNLLRLAIANNKYFAHLFPDFLNKISDLLIPAIQDKDITKMRTILEQEYLEAWGFEQEFKKFQWINYVSGASMEAPLASYLKPSVSFEDLQVRQTISDTLLSAGIEEQPLLTEEIAKLYDAAKDAQPVPLSSLEYDVKSRNALKNIMISRHARYFPYMVQLCRKLNINEPQTIPFLFSTQNILMEYMDMKEEKEVRPIHRIKSYAIVGESL